MKNGIVNVYKEAGFTSHDVVAKMRGIFGQKKIGHTGTLDPAAVGVLPVCLGKATKVCDLLTEKEKTYHCVMLLGLRTDTQDTTGQELSRCPVSVDSKQVQEAVAGFVGGYDQVPPMYSALKVNGKKLYELARAGKEIERKPRPVQIREIRITDLSLPRVSMEVTCSKGTYIRTLCHDIGNALGCGACMEHLARTRVGNFSIEDSITLKELEGLKEEGRLLEALLPTDTVFGQYPSAAAKESGQRLLENGNRLPISCIREWDRAWEKTPLRLYDSFGRFAGIYCIPERETSYNIRTAG